MRLIDADRMFQKVWDGSDDPYTVNDVLELIDEQSTITASPWVEEPPKQNGAYVVWWNYKGTSYWFRGVFFDGRWLFEPGTPKPDYWMPIEPPKEDA